MLSGDVAVTNRRLLQGVAAAIRVGIWPCSGSGYNPFR
jgi:hypothetical protein